MAQIFFRYFNRITYQSLVLTYHSGYAMNFLLLWVRCFTLKLGWQKLGMILESKVSKELKKSKNFTQTKKYLLLNSFKWKLFSEDLNDSWNWKLTSVWQLLWTCHFLKPSFPLNNEYVRNEWWLQKKINWKWIEVCFTLQCFPWFDDLLIFFSRSCYHKR